VFDLVSSLNFFELILFVIWIAFWLYWFISALRTRSPVKRRQSSWFPLLPVVVIAIWITVANIFTPGLLLLRVVPFGTVVALAGTIITLSGLGFAVWARVHLGTNWSSQPAIKVDHSLIMTGPYRIVRHPIYTGLLVGFAGTALVIGEIWAVLAIFILLAVFYVKIWMEEKFLLEEFGETFIHYKNEVKALIPFIL
jgi:protein-S-isoprenylcysteine O-methyltransferase Ste14